MKYILEVRNPEGVDIDTFSLIISNYISNMIIYGYPITTEIFTTVNDWMESLKTRERISMVDESRKVQIKYEGMDFKPNQDYFYVSVDINESDAEKIHQGRGALIPRIYNVTLKDMDKPFYWFDRPELATVFPSHSITTEHEFKLFYHTDPVVIAMDYIQKGGQ